MEKFVRIKCSFCGNNFLKEFKRVKESTKRGWKFYCSNECLHNGRNRRVLIKCSNPSCEETFLRLKSHLNNNDNDFCSHSCAMFVNNKRYPRIRGIRKICATCGKLFFSRKKYCSVTCKAIEQTMNKTRIIDEIKKFYEQNGRIPLKKEFIHAKTARLRFGSWNKAILAAGFKPNPVKFARKHIAIDGHKCDSFAEFIIDNWLFTNNIQHKIHIPYSNSHMSSDFSIDTIRIEFIGLAGENKKYDQLLKIKRDMVRKEKLKVIEIYPKDLFPKNNLKKILRPLLKT